MDLPSWQTVLAALETVIPKFLFKQFHEEINQEQCGKLVARVLEHCGLTCVPAATAPRGKHLCLKIRGLLWRD